MSSVRDVPDKMPAVEKLPCSRGKIFFRYLLAGCIAVLILALSLLQWGSYLLVSDDPLPSHLEGAVVLQGSVLGEEARVAGAMRLLEKGVVSRILISVPKETYWGQLVAPLARAHLEKIYGHEFASYVDFCDTSGVDSTEQEAQALVGCINEHKWHSFTVVTSDYHTRRAGIIWKKIFRQYPSIHLWIHAVPDPEFYSGGWWRERRSAKTWLFELTKLAWTLCGQN